MCASLSPSKRSIGPAPPSGDNMAHQPDLAGAAAHLVGLIVGGLRQRRQRAPELDDIAVAVVPLVEQFEILDDLVDCGHGANSSDMRFRRASHRYIGSCLLVAKKVKQRPIMRGVRAENAEKMAGFKPTGLRCARPGAAAAEPAHARPAARSASVSVPRSRVETGTTFGAVPALVVVAVEAVVLRAGIEAVISPTLAVTNRIERARAGLRLVAERDRDLAADLAGVGLALAEAAHVGDGGARQRHRLLRVDLRLRRDRRACRRSAAAGKRRPTKTPCATGRT